MLNIFGSGEKTNFELGYMYEYGVNVEKSDDNKAIKYYQKVCDDADIAIDYLDKFWKNARMNEVYINHFKEAVKYLKIADDEGCAGAYCHIGNIYKRGIDYMHDINAKPNIDKALECYKKAAVMGSFSAYSNLGYMYDNGKGVAKNYDKARKYYAKCDDIKLATHYYVVGIILQYYERDIINALKYYEKSGELGFISAYKYLVYIYKNEICIKKDDDKINRYNKEISRLENIEI